MRGSDNKMNDDYWKGGKKGNQRGPIQPKKQRDGRGSAGRTWYRMEPPRRVLPGTEMAELQSMGQQKGLSPGATLSSYLSFLICTMGATTPPPCRTILRRREHTVCKHGRPQRWRSACGGRHRAAERLTGSPSFKPNSPMRRVLSVRFTDAETEAREVV